MINMSENARRCIEVVLLREGGYVNDPDDAGGETKYGITKRWYPHLNIKDLTVEDAMDIYYADFWMPLGCEALPLALAMHVLCHGLTNWGSAKSITRKVLDEAGPQSVRRPLYFQVLRFADMRKRWYTACVTKRPKNLKFLRGWMLRVDRTQDLIESGKLKEDS